VDITSRISVLQEKHTELDRMINDIEKSKVFDDQELAEKKKKRLHIKDELAKLQRQQFDQQHEVLNWDE